MLWVKLVKILHGDNGGFDCISNRNIGACSWARILASNFHLLNHGIYMDSVLKKKIGNGRNTKFWKDIWCENQCLAVKIPRIFELDINKDCYIGERLIYGVWVWDW